MLSKINIKLVLDTDPKCEQNSDCEVREHWSNPRTKPQAAQNSCFNKLLKNYIGKTGTNCNICF